MSWISNVLKQVFDHSKQVLFESMQLKYIGFTLNQSGIAIEVLFFMIVIA